MAPGSVMSREKIKMSEAVDGWVHSNGTPCPEYLAPTGRAYWCTTHQMDVIHPFDNPAPPHGEAGASGPSRLTPDQQIRAIALQCATAGGSENSINRARKYVVWIKNGD